MDFKQAYETIVRRSIEKNTKEIPAILSCVDFENKKVLEIGAGPEARIAVKISGFAKHITVLEKPEIIEEINKTIKQNKLDHKIKIQKYNKNEKFPFEDNEFDIVYCAWLPHKTVTDEDFLKEVIRVAKKHVLILMPGIQGHEPELVSIINENEKQRRQHCKEQISDFLLKHNFSISYKDDILILDFKNEDEIFETFQCLAFKNNIPENKTKEIKDFLADKIHSFEDGFYIISGEKSQ